MTQKHDNPPQPQKPKRKYNKLTRQQRKEAAEVCILAISAGTYKHEIKRELRKRFGPISARHFERHLARARAIIHKEFFEKTKQELQGESCAFYNRFTRKPGVSDRDSLHARGRIDKLLGLEPPQQQVSVGGEITMVHVAEQVQRMKERGLWDGVPAEMRGRLEAAIAESNGEPGRAERLR